MKILFVDVKDGESVNDTGAYVPSQYTLWGNGNVRKVKHLFTISSDESNDVIRVWVDSIAEDIDSSELMLKLFSSKKVNVALRGSVIRILNTSSVNIKYTVVRNKTHFGASDTPVSPVNQYTGKPTKKFYMMNYTHNKFIYEGEDKTLFARVFDLFASPKVNNEVFVKSPAKTGWAARLEAAQQDADGDVKNIG